MERVTVRTVPAEAATANFVPAAGGNTKVASVVRIYWAYRERRRLGKPSVKSPGLTRKVRRGLLG